MRHKQAYALLVIMSITFLLFVVHYFVGGLPIKINVTSSLRVTNTGQQSSQTKLLNTMKDNEKCQKRNLAPYVVTVSF